MNVFQEQNTFVLPEELACKYEIKSCVKYTEQTGAYLLRERSSKRLFLLKTACGSVYAEMLANEKSILEYIHKTEHAPLAAAFPIPVHLNVHNQHPSYKNGFPDPSGSSGRPFLCGKKGGITFYIRTYIEGKTLEELCETNYSRPGLSFVETLDYGINLARLLRFMHQMNPPLIHRDIKPQNVIVSTDGTCHFIDFGISRLHQAPFHSSISRMGTKLTAPPEQFYRQTDVRSDLYSFGILLFYCMTGEYQITEHCLGELPVFFQHIIKKLTMPDPDMRYQNADALTEDLLAARSSVL